MKSWSYFIWFKRLIPFVLLGLIWLAYVKIRDYRQDRQARFESKIALVTAHIWIAGAKYHDNPDRFMQYRDSVLKANDLNLDEIEDYASKYQKEPEKYERVAELTAEYVDSLYELEDSLLHMKTDTSVVSVDSTQQKRSQR
ncbi:MAG: hypothetical protein PVH24_04595 [Candidatus Zixiibacteriota bacterium]|jgi:hypothetical protein